MLPSHFLITFHPYFLQTLSLTLTLTSSKPSPPSSAPSSPPNSSPSSSLASTSPSSTSYASYLSFQGFVDFGRCRYLSASWGGIQWEKQVRTSAQIHRQGGMSVLIIGAAGFVSSHVSLMLKRRGDDIVGLHKHNVFIIVGDLNDHY